MAKQHRRGVDEQPSRADAAGQAAEDGVETERLELDVHVVLPSDREEDVRRLEGRSGGTPDERLPPEDRSVGEVTHGLVRRAQLLHRHDALQRDAKVELLAGLALADDLHGLRQLA